MGRFLGGKGRPSSFFVTMGRSPVYSGSLIVGEASVGDKNPKILLSRGVVLSQSTFHLVVFYFSLFFRFWAVR